MLSLSYMKKLLTILLFILISSVLFADQLYTLEKAILMADSRLAHGILIESYKSEAEFEKQAGTQIEFALINLDSRDMLTEDWYDLALYCLARKYKYYNLALRLLKKEYEIEKYPRLSRWIMSRVKLLEAPGYSEESFNVTEELRDFRRRVF